MANTIKTYVSDGVRTSYPVDFTLGYLNDKSFVFVYQGEDHTIQLGYTWTDEENINLNAPVPTGESFSIRRIVPRTRLINDYVDGAQIRERNLDQSYSQALMIIEEIEDGFVTTIPPWVIKDLTITGTLSVNELQTPGGDDWLAQAQQAAIAAQTAQAAAEAAEAGTQVLYTDFNDRYYGPYQDDPATAPSGAPSTAGDLYFNTTTEQMKEFTGAIWKTLFAADAVDITYDSTASNLQAANVQAAIDELAGKACAVQLVQTVADMKLANLQVGDLVTTAGYYTPGDRGAASYLIKANAAVDGYGDHLLANGNIAVLKEPTTRDVYHFGARGDGVTDDAYCIAAADIRNALRLPNGIFRISTNLVLTNTVYHQGGQFLVDLNRMLTIPSVAAEPTANLFTGTGTVTGLTESYVNWFGAVADGVTDTSSASNKAIQSTSGTVRWAAAPLAYVVAAPLIIDKALELVGGCTTKIKLGAVDFMQIRASNICVNGFDVDGTSVASHIIHLETGVTGMEQIRIQQVHTNRCGTFVYDDDAANLVVGLYITDCIHRFPYGRSVLLRDVFAFLFIKGLTCDYTSVVDASSNIPAISISNNQGCILEDVDVLGGELVGFSSRWGINIEASAAVFLRRCNADTMGGYGFRIVNVEGCRLDTVTASLCDLYGIIIGGTTFDLQGTNVYAGGRQGLGGTPDQHGVYIVDTATNINISNITTKNNTGSGVATAGSASVNISGLTTHGNNTYGVQLTGLSGIVTGAIMTGNTAGSYALASAANHVTSVVLPSGALVQSATGPV